MSQDSKLNKSQVAMKAGMHEQTARKYLQVGKLPSELTKTHNWENRKNPFADVWSELKEKLAVNPGLVKQRPYLSTYSGNIPDSFRMDSTEPYNAI